VLEALSRYYASENANIHRGVYALSQQATDAYEGARGKVARFLNAAEPAEIVFTRNATEGINLVAQTFGRQQVGEGDEVVISTMEHHSNIVPWQMLCEEKGARLRVVPITDAGELMLDELASLLGPRTKLLSIVHMSNSLGTINPVRRVVSLPRRRACRCWSTGRRRRITCRSTCRRLAAISTWSRATSCTGRPVSVRSMGVGRCSTPCHRTRVAAT
jgi:cysteine desulfurase/selenocysteine lyase